MNAIGAETVMSTTSSYPQVVMEAETFEKTGGKESGEPEVIAAVTLDGPFQATASKEALIISGNGWY